MITKVILYSGGIPRRTTPRGRSPTGASSATPRATSAETVGVEAVEVRGLGEAEKEGEETEEAGEVPEDGDDFYVDYYFKSNNKNDLSISPFIPDISNEDAV